MSKKNKKAKQKKAGSEQASPPPKPLLPSKDYSYIITGVFFVLAVFGIMNHEMWRDEYQAWMIVINAHSFTGLYANCTYEGAPMLWHILLYILSWFSKDIIMMKILHVVIATGSVFLINRFSGFSLLAKVLMSFSYYTFFEYAMIARCYSLGFFLVLFFCALYQYRSKNLLWLGIVLAALANTSAYGLVIAGCLSLVLLWDYLQNRQSSEWSGATLSIFSVAAIIFFLGALVSVIQIMPESDNNTQSDFRTLMDPGRIKVVFSKVYSSFLLFPEFKNLPVWNTTGLVGVDTDKLATSNWLSLLILLVNSVLLARKPALLLFYWASTAGLAMLFGLTFLTAPRYAGHLVLVFIAALWLSRHIKETYSAGGLIRRLSDVGKKYRDIYLYLIFGAQALTGVAYYLTDLNNDFSSSKKTAEFIHEQKLDTLPVIATTDYAVSGFSYLLNQPIYYPERKEYGTFIIWDGQRKVDMDFNKVIHAIDTVFQKKSEALVILNYQPSYVQGNDRVFLEHAMLSPTIQLDIQGKFEKSMVPDEVYYVYMAKKMAPQAQQQNQMQQ